MPYYPPASGGTDATKLPLAGGTMTGTLTHNPGSALTASTPAIDIAQEWNNAGVSFRGIRFVLTNTANASTSRFMEFLIGATTQFAVTRAGQVSGASVALTGGECHLNSNPGFRVASSRHYCWASTVDAVGGTTDTGLSRNAAGVVEVNNGTAGTFRDLKIRDLIATVALNVQGASASVASGISIGGAVRTTVGAAGGASALPATPTGYLDFYVGSTAVGIPYYARGA
jgi:hypothetical protein